MNPVEKPWAFERITHYAQATDVQIVEAGALTESSFQARHIDAAQPCLIKGAVRHWPAASRWKSRDYLKTHIGGVKKRVNLWPQIDTVRLFDRKRRFATQIAASRFRGMPMSEFLDTCEGEPYLEAAGVFAGGDFAPIAGDLGGFSFIPPSLAPVLYPRFRTFMYVGSFSDWHMHFCDETLMCQVVGAKETLLVPPQSWRAFRFLLEQAAFSFDGPWERAAPLFAGVPWLRAQVEEGDALYIPPFWWHAVRAVDQKFGVTVPACWRSSFKNVARLELEVSRHILLHKPLGYASLLGMHAINPVLRLFPSRLR